MDVQGFIDAANSYAYKQWKSAGSHVAPWDYNQVLDIIQSSHFKEWQNNNPNGTIDQYYIYLSNRQAYLNSPEYKIESLGEEIKELNDEISELKAVCGEKKMKVILETGCLKTAQNIKKASILSMYAGADYIKTSTGKLEPAATPEAAYVMCQAIKEYYEKTGIQIGFKPAGGLNSVMDAVIMYTIVKEVLGEQWLTNQWFRMGTSRLANLLLSEVVGQETKFF